MSMSGERTAMRMSIMNAFCTLVISVVILVTRPGTLNLSMLENEKVCMLLYIDSRRLAAKPAEALAANLPARAPKTRLKKAMTTMSMP